MGSPRRAASRYLRLLGQVDVAASEAVTADKELPGLLLGHAFAVGVEYIEVIRVHGNANGAVRRLRVIDQLAQVSGCHLVGLAATVDVEQSRIRQQFHGAPRQRAGYDLAVQPQRL
jgi:hypothetical protein